MEVFLDQRNRRSPPAVWGPPVGVEEEPPRGLFNIGNTCFMNAALQCMAAVKPLNSFILGNSCSFKGILIIINKINTLFIRINFILLL
jgi:ubiquitin C-terminal hydrolase